MNRSNYPGDVGRAYREAYSEEPAPTLKQLYRVTLIDGTIIDGLTYEESTKYFYGYAGSTIKPWPVTEYRAP